MRTSRSEEHPTRAVSEHGSAGASVTVLARGGGASVVRLELAPGGVLGRHPAAGPQLLLVVAGEGTVSGEDGEPRPVAAGAVVRWAAGELHETRSERGLVAIAVEVDGLDPFPA